MTSYSEVNRRAYDRLAQEYEGRATHRKAATSEVADAVVRYAADGPVLDLGCGVGLLVELLRHRGVPAIGIDYSYQMVSFARNRNGAASVVHGDFMEYQFDTQFAAAVSMAVIHLFPRNDALRVLARVRDLLLPGGVLYMGTTKAAAPDEGYVTKSDYSGDVVRYRRKWTEPEFEALFLDAQFQTLERLYIEDEDGKLWMDFIARPA